LEAKENTAENLQIQIKQPAGPSIGENAAVLLILSGEELFT